MANPKLLIETIEIGSGDRQIGPYRRGTVAVNDRRAELQAALTEIVTMAQAAAAATDDSSAWSVEAFEATFGVNVLESGGVLIGGAHGDAAIEIKLTLKPGE
ncbi:CU044_2847 family protein [Micromonospora sp. NPDC047557]|uniref:CU044_2847 family protein n=1 Tax=Micromonospora sp. NPDC047557 TaxID=3364250 RepID=UPI00371B8621